MRVLAALWSARVPMTVTDISVQVGLHPNTVRFHLGVLTKQGLISHHSEERDIRGRPHILYSANAARVHSGRRNYRLLAQVLVTFASEAMMRKGRKTLMSAGTAWGRRLANQRVGFSVETPLQQLVYSLTELGFEPELATPSTSPKILMHQCPFLEAAEQSWTTVCTVHLGLMRGLICGYKMPMVIERLDPFVEPSLCVVALSPTV